MVCIYVCICLKYINTYRNTQLFRNGLFGEFIGPGNEKTQKGTLKESLFVCIRARKGTPLVFVSNIRKNTTILTYICKNIHKGSKNLLFENSTALAVKKNLKVLKAPEKEPK